MKQQSGKLGIREYVSLLILMVGMKTTEDTAAVLYKEVKNAAWMIPILSGVLFFIPYFLLLKTLSVYKDKNLFSVIQQVLGKYMGFLVCLFIYLVNTYAIASDSRTYTEIIRTFYFTTTPKLVIYAILLFVCAYGAIKGIQHIGSVSYLFIFFVLVSFYIVLALSTKGSSYNAMFPIWGPGISEIVKGSALRLTLFADFFVITTIAAYMNFKDFRKGTLFTFGYIVISFSIAFFIYICLFDQTLRGTFYPFHIAIRYISFGKYFGNIETIFFPIWLLAAFIRFSVFLYINALMFGHIFKIKEFQYLIPSLATIYLLIGMIPESPIDVIVVFKAKIQYLAGPAFVGISFILWFVALCKGEFKYAKNKNSL